MHIQCYKVASALSNDGSDNEICANFYFPLQCISVLCRVLARLWTSVKKKPMCTYKRNIKNGTSDAICFLMLLTFSLSLPSFADFTDSKSGPVRALYVFVQKEQKEKKFTCRRASNASSSYEWWREKKSKENRNVFCAAI